MLYFSSDLIAYLQHRPESVEEPSVTVDLFLVFLLHAKHYLRWHNALVRILEVQVRVQCKGSRVLEEMRCDLLVVNFVLHVISRLVDS